MSDSFKLKALQEEKSRLDNILKNCLSANDGGIDYILKDDDLDTVQAEKQMQSDISGADVKEHKLSGIIAGFGVAQAEQRIRRDYRISRSSHKDLVLGCLGTLYRRSKKLEKILK